MSPEQALEMIGKILHAPQFTTNYESFKAIDEAIAALAVAIRKEPPKE